MENLEKILNSKDFENHIKNLREIAKNAEISTMEAQKCYFYHVKNADTPGDNSVFSAAFARAVALVPLYPNLGFYQVFTWTYDLEQRKRRLLK